jgi:hypothetical protein
MSMLSSVILCLPLLLPCLSYHFLCSSPVSATTLPMFYPLPVFSHLASALTLPAHPASALTQTLFSP